MTYNSSRVLAKVPMLMLLATLVHVSVLGADVSTGMFEFNKGNYHGALSEFEEAARTGDAQAQTRLAEMYEKGLGVTRDYVSAHAWYNVAAARGNTLARTARDSLQERLPVSAVANAQEMARNIMTSMSSPISGRNPTIYEGQLDVSSSFGSFSGEALTITYATTYRPSATAGQMVDDVLKYNSVPSRSFTILETPQVPNAAAVIEGGRRYILYNPAFMNNVNASASTPWEAYSIMAHEIGHHLAGHTLESTGSRPVLELEADYFSAGTLARMGASLDEAQAAMRRLGSPAGTHTHPSRDQRLQAIRSGWQDAVNLSDGNTSQQPQTIGEHPPELSVRIPPISVPSVTQWPIRTAATFCIVAPQQFCQLRVPLPVGSQCTCFTPYGQYPGVTQ